MGTHICVCVPASMCVCVCVHVSVHVRKRDKGFYEYNIKYIAKLRSLKLFSQDMSSAVFVLQSKVVR